MVLSVVPELVGDVLGRARSAGVVAAVLGSAGEDRLVVDGPAGTVVDVALDDATRAWRDAIPSALGVAAPQSTRSPAILRVWSPGAAST